MRWRILERKIVAGRKRDMEMRMAWGRKGVW